MISSILYPVKALTLERLLNPPKLDDLTKTINNPILNGQTN
jgi:hypothetical protein